MGSRIVGKKKRNLIIAFAIIYAVIAAGLYVFVYLIPHISGVLTTTYIVKAVNMDNYYNGTAIVVRDETCVFGNASGTVTYYVNESEKTRVGTRVADIYTSNDRIGLFCPVTGFVSFYYDGYEDVLTPTSVLTMDPAEYPDIQNHLISTEKTGVEAGDFIYKVVDGGNWYLLLTVTEEQLQTFRIGSNIEVLLEDGTVLTAEAERVLGRDKLAVMAKVLSYYPDFCKKRTLNARVSTKQTKGLGIPVTSVAYDEEEKPGVYVLGTDGEYHFTRVNILDEKDGNYAVSEDQFTELQSDGSEKTIYSISLYDEIIRDVSEQYKK